MSKKSNILWVPVLILLLLNSCNMKKEADSIFYNGTFYLVDEAFTTSNAIVVKNGKIVESGDYLALSKKYNPQETVDMNGRFVYPGFYDGHCHFLGYGLNFNEADLTGTTSVEDIIQRLKEFKAKNSSRWLIGRGWDQNDWIEASFPDKKLLDEHFPGTPVFLTRIDGHAAWVNSAALEIAGITSDTKTEGGQVIVENNQATGILIDKAIDLVFNKIPPPGREQKRLALLKAQEQCLSVGLTSVADAGLHLEDIQLIETMHNDSSLKLRIYGMMIPTEENLNRMRKQGVFQTDRFTVRSIKLYADGALGSRGALLLEPYSDDPENQGLLLHPLDEIKAICDLAKEYNFQVNTHCIGDSANRLVLDLYGEILENQNNRRWRIEHAQIVHPDDFKKFETYSIVPSVQPTHATSDMYWVEERLGEERLNGAYAYQKLLDQNKWLINGSDFPVESINPLLGFYAAVARQDIKQYPEGGFQSENKLNREQALRAITIWPAKGGFEEQIKGSLEPGKVADFVVLDQDIMQVDLPEIPGIKVAETYMDGERVYSR